MNQSNVGIIKSTNARCLNLSCDSWSPQGTVCSQFGLHSGSSQSVFCGNTINCNLCFNSWSPERCLSSNSVCLYLSSHSWSSECWLGINFSLNSWSSESILCGYFSLDSWSSQSSFRGGSWGSKISSQSWSSKSTFNL